PRIAQTSPEFVSPLLSFPPPEIRARKSACHVPNPETRDTPRSPSCLRPAARRTPWPPAIIGTKINRIARHCPMNPPLTPPGRGTAPANLSHACSFRWRCPLEMGPPLPPKSPFLPPTAAYQTNPD